jgi:hypothetical protein
MKISQGFSASGACGWKHIWGLGMRVMEGRLPTADAAVERAVATEGSNDAVLAALCGEAISALHQERWAEAAVAVDAVAREPARSPAMLTAKINLWRVLAPEDLFDPERQTLDERLLASIVADASRAKSFDS